MSELSVFLTDVVGVVEATHFEQVCLWQFNEDQSSGVDWVENSNGRYECVAEFSKRPVNISLQTAIIDGHKILFYYPSSTLVDYDMIDQWMEEYLPDSARHKDGLINRTNAGNFHNVFPCKST